MALPPDLRQDFPFLKRMHPNGRPWVYLDSAATTLKPRQVIEAVGEALAFHSTNVHRSVYGLGDETTERFESARSRIARFIGAQAHEIIFVRNATEALNLVAQGYPRNGVTLASWGEHHSNLLPWQTGKMRGIAPLPDGSPNISAFLDELKKGDVSVVTVSQVSNVTGFQTDVRALAEAAHRHGAVLVVDGAQSAGRLPIDVLELDCDFLAFSGHKMYGPTGIGVLYGKADRLAELKPLLYGGGTVESVSSGGTTKRAIPWRFEAGTPPVEAVLGLGTAVDYLQSLGMEAIASHERELARYTRQQFQYVPGCCAIVDSVEQAVGVQSFYFENESSHVIARSLSDRFGICARSGHLCAQPLFEYLKKPPAIRVSFGIYNRESDIENCVSSLREIILARSSR